jgi:hypothetical protein
MDGEDKVLVGTQLVPDGTGHFEGHEHGRKFGSCLAVGVVA